MHEVCCAELHNVDGSATHQFVAAEYVIQVILCFSEIKYSWQILGLSVLVRRYYNNKSSNNEFLRRSLLGEGTRCEQLQFGRLKVSILRMNECSEE